MGRGLRAVGRGRAGWRKINLPGGAGGGGGGGGPLAGIFFRSWSECPPGTLAFAPRCEPPRARSRRANDTVGIGE
eukprot:gene19343-biopygen10022